MNWVLEDMLRHYVNPKQDNRDELLPAAEFAVNNAYQESIQDTPFYLNNGRHPRLPSDLPLGLKPRKNPAAYGNIEKALTRARFCLQAAQQRQKHYADDKRVDLHFKVGDSVSLSSEHIIVKAVGARKLLPRWLGPFTVLEKVTSVNYTLDIPAHYRIPTFHVSMLHPAYDNGSGEGRPPLIMIDGEEELELQTILQHRPLNKTNGDSGISYLVKWKGYGPVHNSWEPERLLKQRAVDMLQDYWNEVSSALPAVGAGLAPNQLLLLLEAGVEHLVNTVPRGRNAHRGSLRPVSRKLKKR